MDPRIKTLADAQAQLADIERRWDNYSGNNPDRFDSGLKYWGGVVADLTRTLKMEGLIAATADELLEFQLDREFPRARSKEIVSFGGKRYRRRFAPAVLSRSRKTVIRWSKWWEPVADATAG